MGAAAVVGIHASDDHVHAGHATGLREKLDELSKHPNLDNDMFHSEMKSYFASLHPPDWQHPENIKETPVHSHGHAHLHHGHMSHHAAAGSEDLHTDHDKLAAANKLHHHNGKSHEHRHPVVKHDEETDTTDLQSRLHNMGDPQQHAAATLEPEAETLAAGSIPPIDDQAEPPKIQKDDE